MEGIELPEREYVLTEQAMNSIDRVLDACEKYERGIKAENN
jgi:hypothetical protein